MLKGISPLLSPDLLATLYRMGHGEEILLADAHFPVHQCGVPVLRADGLKIADLLGAILPLLELDAYVPSPALVMEPVAGDVADPAVLDAYQQVLDHHHGSPVSISQLERFAFYKRAKGCHAVLATGDSAKYANLILKKGVTPSNPASTKA